MRDGALPEPKIVRTSAGRAVSYYEFGDAAGTPLFALHGTPACGAGFAWTDSAARERGIRVLAPDRPGIGGSEPVHYGRAARVIDYADELFATTDALDIERFAVLGYSGGGPFALAAAHEGPERVTSAAVVAGSGEVGAWARLREFDMTDQQLSWLALHAPNLARAVLATTAAGARRAPGLTARLTRIGMSRADRAVMASFESPQVALALFTEAFSRGAGGVVNDYATLARRWGFTVEDIVVPLQYWHATDDHLVPLRHSEELAARTSRAAVRVWPGEGHLAIIDHIGEVLDRLLATV